MADVCSDSFGELEVSAWHPGSPSQPQAIRTVVSLLSPIAAAMKKSLTTVRVMERWYKFSSS
jgi:hypothetical protein